MTCEWELPLNENIQPNVRKLSTTCTISCWPSGACCMFYDFCGCHMHALHALPTFGVSERAAKFSCCKTFLLFGLSLSLPILSLTLSSTGYAGSQPKPAFSAIFSAFILGTIRHMIGTCFRNPLLPERKCRNDGSTPPPFRRY